MADGNYVRVTRLGVYPEHLVQAVRQAAATMFDPEIADLLDLSIPQVRNIRKKNDIPARVPPDRWTPERDAQLLEIYIRQSLPAKEAGKIIGVSEAAVRARAKSLNVRRPPISRKASPPRQRAVEVVEPLAPVRVVQRAAFSALPRSVPVAFLARSPTGCRWPIDGPHDEALCCNLEMDPKHPSYCRAHKRVARDGWGAIAKCLV